MFDANFVTLSGRLTADPKVGIGKVKYAFYSIAINKTFNNSKKVTYVNIAAFGNEADYVEAFMKKGKKVMIRGELDVDKNGKLMVVANEQSVKENVLYQRNQPQQTSQTNGAASSRATSATRQEPQEEYKPFTGVSDDGNFTPIYPTDDELPFK